MTSPATNTALDTRAASIRLLALDVDGVLTDGSLHYHSDGSETKVFTTQDGLGMRLLQEAGITLAIITGRSSEMVTRRARELGVTYLLQDRNDKALALTEVSQESGIPLDQCAYCGDDLPDLGAILSAGLGISVANAPEQVRDRADLVTERAGGHDAVREICEFLLNAKGALSGIIERYCSMPSNSGQPG